MTSGILHNVEMLVQFPLVLICWETVDMNADYGIVQLLRLISSETVTFIKQ